MRVKSKLWVQAYIRRCQLAGAVATLLCRGDEDAGAIYIKLNYLNGEAQIFAPAPTWLMPMPAKNEGDGQDLKAEAAKLFSGPSSRPKSSTPRSCSQAEFNQETERRWYCALGPQPKPEIEIEDYLRQQTKIDNDIWIIEIEDSEGRDFLDEALIDIEE